MSTSLDENSMDEQEEDDDAIVVFLWRCLFTALAIILVTLLYCLSKRQRRRQEVRHVKHTKEEMSSVDGEDEQDGDMEMVSAGHKTTIEIKTFKTAVVKTREDGVDGVSDGPLALKKMESNLVEEEKDDLSEYAVVQVVVGNHGTGSYAPQQQSVEEENDQLMDLAEVESKQKWSKRKSSVLEVTGSQNIREVLEKVDSLEKVTEIMRMAGLESSHLIFGIDYTASNRTQGRLSFGGDSLHTITTTKLNPYQQVISIMGQTLAPLASTGYIPAYGFGDIRTSDTSIFPLKNDGFCQSFDQVLDMYNDITPNIILSGPTNFAPLIYQAIEICKDFKKYHVLVIVADGQVTNESATREAIVAACQYPLSIIVVGVGDGPWDMMEIFDEKLPKRAWDNFHFVNYHQITSSAKHPELSFAVEALLEIPDQYKAVKALGLLNFQ